MITPQISTFGYDLATYTIPDSEVLKVCAKPIIRGWNMLREEDIINLSFEFM